MKPCVRCGDTVRDIRGNCIQCRKARDNANYRKKVGLPPERAPIVDTRPLEQRIDEADWFGNSTEFTFAQIEANQKLRFYGWPDEAPPRGSFKPADWETKPDAERLAWWKAYCHGRLKPAARAWFDEYRLQVVSQLRDDGVLPPRVKH
jgi:hypothetical protein